MAHRYPVELSDGSNPEGPEAGWVYIAERLPREGDFITVRDPMTGRTAAMRVRSVERDRNGIELRSVITGEEATLQSLWAHARAASG